MESFFKTYTYKLKFLSPVHIGDGDCYERTSYIIKNNKIHVFNGMSFFRVLSKMGLIAKYEEFCSRSGSKDIMEFFLSNRCNIDELITCTDRTIDIADVQYSPNSVIGTFVRDSYGNPYIPGSSIKGALRTAIESAIVLSENGLDKNLNLDSAIRDTNRSRNRYLRDQNKSLSILSLHQNLFSATKRDTNQVGDVRNDILRGMTVSDSIPLSDDDLCIGKLVSVNSDSVIDDETPIYAEFIKPGTEITFNVTFDTSVTEHKELSNIQKRYLSQDGLLEAARESYKNYRTKYGQNFSISSNNDEKEYILYLGKYTGFVSKTEIYSIYDEENAREATSIVLETSCNPRYTVPKWLRVLKYRGVDYQPGRCELIK